MGHIIISEYIVCFETLLCIFSKTSLPFCHNKNLREVWALEHYIGCGGAGRGEECVLNKMPLQWSQHSLISGGAGLSVKFT